jgi:nicotinate-nucleotide adenylyltransferase
MITGLFFGSFNPIHIGHLALANYITAYTDIEEIWFVVSPQNPLKQRNQLLDDYQRLHLVNLALRDFPRFKACNIEFKMPKPSYTVDTLAYLDEKFPDRQFVLIMGEDNLETLTKWKNYEQLLEKRQILIYPRPNSKVTEFHHHKNIKQVNAPMMEISSSFIRKAISEGKDIRFFLPEKVWDYVVEMNFYKSKTD